MSSTVSLQSMLITHLQREAPWGLPADCLASQSKSSEVPSSVGPTLGVLESKAKACVSCRLSETRTNVVFGVGSPNARLVFVGEGPGADEDRLGEPFVGKAGMLLTAAITKGMGLKREEVYICNVVKCRPPENRTPLPDEVQACSSFLEQQLLAIQPEVIVTLGAPAQVALCGNTGGITKLRGNWLNWRGIPVMPTLHPAYILRTPNAKKDFWADLQDVMRVLGISKPSTQNHTELV